MAESRHRALWYETHLFEDAAGKRARRNVEKLDAAVATDLLESGDRLAELSISAAQHFFRQAADVIEHFGVDSFAEWRDGGDSLLREETALREAAIAYFSISASRIQRCGVRHLLQWRDVGRDVARTSKKLAISFFSGTCPIVDQVDMTTMQAWAQLGMRTHQDKGWQGEFLARSFFEASASALKVLNVEDFSPWAALAAELQKVAKTTFTVLPTSIAALKSDERALLWSSTSALAEADPKIALNFLQNIPPLISRLKNSNRLKILGIFESTSTVDPTSVGEIVPVIRALIRAIPNRYRQKALDQIVKVAAEFPAGGMAMLRSSPIAYEDAAAPDVEYWVQRGVEIATQNEAGGSRLLLIRIADELEASAGFFHRGYPQRSAARLAAVHTNAQRPGHCCPAPTTPFNCGVHWKSFPMTMKSVYL